MIMRNIFKITIVFTLLLTIGCSKEFLDPVPQTSLSDLTVYDTKDRVVAQVNGMYDAMKSANYLGGRYFVYNDIRAENFIPKSTNGVTNYQTWNHTVISSTNEVQNCWSAIYGAINTINIFSEGLDLAWTAGKLTGKITQADYDQYRSEALAMRAICYFHLLQLYAKPYNMGSGSNPGLPLRLKAEKTSENSDLARSTVAEIYTQILKDLDAAEPLAISSYATDLENTTRIHKNTIIAFKTRVYLHMQNWASVVTESAKIVSASAPFTASSGVAFALTPSYATLWTNYTTKESIFSMPATTTDNAGSQNSLPYYYYYTTSESYYLNTAAGTAYALMNAADVRKTSLLLNSGNYFLSKWTDATSHTNFAPVMRYAEVLLNRSEALVRAGGTVTQGAVDLLNAVRVRSYPAGAYTLASFATAADFYTAILTERNIEFLGEGIRNMDLMRLSLTIPGKNGGSMGNIVAITPTSPSYIWPISANEMTFNKLMTGNE
jgi:starch-binding outer membrane protein, SusD/RagB family